MEAKKDGRFLDDVQSLKAIIGALPPKVREEYEAYGCRTLEAVFPNRRLVVYTLMGGAPVDVGMWRFGDIFLDRVKGPTAEIEVATGVMSTVSVRPEKVGGRDVFLHIPQSFELKWKGKDTPKGIQYVPHYAVLIKTRSREHHQVEGDTYCVTLNKFRERFPEVDLRY